MPLVRFKRVVYRYSNKGEMDGEVAAKVLETALDGLKAAEPSRVKLILKIEGYE